MRLSCPSNNRVCSLSARHPQPHRHAGGRRSMTFFRPLRCIEQSLAAVEEDLFDRLGLGPWGQVKRETKQEAQPQPR